MKRYIIVTVLLTLAFFAFPLWQVWQTYKAISEEPLGETPDIQITPPLSMTAQNETSVTEETQEKIPTEILLSFVGDCMLASDEGAWGPLTFGYVAEENEPTYFLKNFLTLFAEDDWTVANLENVFTDNKKLYPLDKGYSPAYWYRSPTSYTKILTESSVEIVSTANNHSEDYGHQGYLDTLEALDKAGVLWGDNDHMVMLEKDGFRIALYCTTFYYQTYEYVIIDQMKAVDADYKIVYFHGGTERVHVPDEWKAEGCRRMLDNRIDLVIGGHPHVLQPIEEYHGKKIIHSLGNFCFGGALYGEENRTMVYRLHFTVLEGELQAVSDEVIPCYLYREAYQPAIITDQTDYGAVMDFLAGKRASPLPY